MGRPTRDALGSYATVVSISEYTRTWVTRKWARPSDVVYPVCDAVGVGGEKTRSILHVGRFNASDGDQNHHKRQDVLLDAFKALLDLHADGWTMHFAGSTGQGPGGAEYAAALVERARGYPVTFHFDADLGALHALYRSAAVYWHATGYGHSDELYPAKQEHFGITAVEAMSAGAVPVVIRSGGLQETVRHEHDGLLWSTVPELLAHTRRLAADDALRTRFGLAAVASSARFSREAYADAMGAVIERALARRP